MKHFSQSNLSPERRAALREFIAADFELGRGGCQNSVRAGGKYSLFASIQRMVRRVFK